ATQTGSVFGSLSIAKTFVDCAFTGGCVATALVFARRLWSSNVLLAGLATGFVIALLIASSRTFGSFELPADDGARWLLAAQLGIRGITGMSVVVLAGLDLRRGRNAESLLLCLWT